MVITNIRLSGNDCRLASMGKRFEIDQNGLHHCFSDVILDRNIVPDIGMWLFSVLSRLISVPHSCCCCIWANRDFRVLVLKLLYFLKMVPE